MLIAFRKLAEKSAKIWARVCWRKNACCALWGQLESEQKMGNFSCVVERESMTNTHTPTHTVETPAEKTKNTGTCSGKANEKLVTKTVRFSIMALRLVFESNAVRCECVRVCVCVRKSATERARERERERHIHYWISARPLPKGDGEKKFVPLPHTHWHNNFEYEKRAEHE